MVRRPKNHPASKERKKRLFYRKIHRQKQNRLSRSIAANKRAILEIFADFPELVRETLTEEILHPKPRRRRMGSRWSLSSSSPRRPAPRLQAEVFDFSLFFSGVTARLEAAFPSIILAVTKAYEQGASKILNRRGDQVKIDQLVDQEAVQLIATRQVPFIQTLTLDLVNQTREIVAQGLEDGKSTIDIRDQLMEEIPEMADWRSERVARSEIIWAHGEGFERTVKEAGIDETKWTTAKDKKVCPICEYYHNKQFKTDRPRTEVMPKNVDQAKDLYNAGYNLLPVTNSHPNCRCLKVADL